MPPFEVHFTHPEDGKSRHQTADTLEQAKAIVGEMAEAHGKLADGADWKGMADVEVREVIPASHNVVSLD